MDAERRRSVRVPADFELRVETLAGRCVDFSRGGMRVKAEWSVPVGFPVELTLLGIGDGRRRARGRVVHWYDRDGDFGLRFTEIQRGAVRALSQLVRERRSIETRS